VLGDVGGRVIAVVSVRDDADPDARDLLDETRDGAPQFVADLLRTKSLVGFGLR
jgi:hypothetical protein